MSQFDVMAGEEPRRGAFYRCEDATGCGLRFPVAMGDPFHNRCPRCGGNVRMKALAEIEFPPAAQLDASTSVVLPNSQIQLLLDNWRSLFNVGAAFRTADGAGLRHLYLCGITATPDIQRKLAKTALGAERVVAWSYHADAVQIASELQQGGAQIWVLERGVGAVSLFDITSLPLADAIVLVAGNELLGVDPGIVAIADRVVYLPMEGSKQSLNVAVATSVASYWLRAQEMAVPHASGTIG